jgi:hypothetical protein
MSAFKFTMNFEEFEPFKPVFIPLAKGFELYSTFYHHYTGVRITGMEFAKHIHNDDCVTVVVHDKGEVVMVAFATKPDRIPCGFMSFVDVAKFESLLAGGDDSVWQYVLGGMY